MALKVVRVETTAGPIGAIIRDLDVAGTLDNHDIDALRRIFYDRGVVCIRGQSFTPESLLSLAKHFGE